MTIAVTLIEPQYPVNVGHIARLMKNFGLKKLYFVRPNFDKIEAAKYSTHGNDILMAAKSVTLSQLRKKFDVIVGTTAILGSSRLNILRESISAEQLAKIIHDSSIKDFCILLGRESSGLNNEELKLCNLVVTIDTKTNYRTMNVAHALAILLYEISKLQSPELPVKMNKKKIELASQKDIDLLLQYVNKLADAGNYDLHKKPLLESAVKNLLAKSVPTMKDIMLLVSLLRKSHLAIERLRQKNK
ncbi:MAG: RNA methyltransferase [Thermoproteota archaeon]|nr:RNA methyltransferase [Thermoproteota archaeon]MDQ3807406.1 RNA methyltransferase [Thermoproteota archaeon]MDQ5843208.1 RNA methyltransferase [Thermoproteota archaeon]